MIAQCLALPHFFRQITFCQKSLVFATIAFVKGIHPKIVLNYGSHFFRLTNFPDFSSIFCSFPVFFKVLFYLKYGTIFAGFSLLLADFSSILFAVFQYNFFQIFPVLWVKFPDFSRLRKFPDFSRFSNPTGNHVELTNSFILMN